MLRAPIIMRCKLQSSFGTLLRWTPVFGVWLSIGLFGCGTNAVGVEACRKIESARCEAASPCGLLSEKGGGVEECKRFARDNCLHGTGLRAEPGDVAVAECVKALELAGKCAADRNPEYSPSRCNMTVFGKSSANEICEIVSEPERTPQCAFLVPDAVQEAELDDNDAGDGGD
jgi:hypothetical protein